MFTPELGVAATAADRPLSLDGIDTGLLGAGGVFASVTGGALAGNTYRFDRSSVAVPDNVTVIAPLVGPGRWLLFGEPAAAASYVDHVCRPEHYLSSTNWSQLSAGTTYVGGAYVTEKPVSFDRVLFTVAAAAPPYTGKILVYQAGDGIAASAAQLIGSCSFTSLGTGVQTVLLDQGEVHLSEGLYWMLWGKTSGSMQLRTVDVVAIGGLNEFVPVGMHPTVFETTVAVATNPPPPTFDPLQGGGSGTNGVSFDAALVARLKLG